MVDAIIKVSWRRLANGLFSGQAAGGICGSCFTLSSGITLSCAHENGDALFRPNPTFDYYRIWIVETAGKITEIRQAQFRLFPNYDAAIIDNFQSSTRYVISSKNPEEIHECNLLGYEANTAPFQVRVDQTGLTLELYAPHVFDARQHLNALIPVPTIINFTSPDVNLLGKKGYVIDAKAKVGLSGGPMVDAADNSAIGLCSFGLPADVNEKTQIGVVDIRQFPFI